MAKIMIDAGHGGSDPGASGNGLVEKVWALEVAKELEKILKGLGHVVLLSRSGDQTVGLTERTNLANRLGADIFISIHFNAGGGFGWEDFIFNGNVSANTHKLQNSIHDAIKPILTKHGLKNRGKKRANFAVLRQTRMPSILLEGGFVDTSDSAVLKKSSYKKDVAAAVANGVQRYLGQPEVKPAIEAGWKKNGTGWWYQNADGSYPRNQWQKISGIWYYFGKHGYISIGWRKINDVWYYFHTNGRMLTGWQKVNGKWYYLHTNGAMRTGLIEVKGKHYYLERNGALITDEAIELEANKHGHLK